MIASQVFTGALLFALLFVHAHCGPVKTGFGSNTGYAGSGYSGSANDASGSKAADSADQTSSASIVGYSGSATVASPNPAAFAVSGPGFQTGPQDVNWVIQPLSLLSGDESYVTSAAGSSAHVYPGAVAQGAVAHGATYGAPTYNAGDYAGYEASYEHGDGVREMGGYGYVAPSPMLQDASLQYNYHSGSTGSDMTGVWGVHPFYDYMFMTGQYPPGILTHSSRSYEQGADGFADVHYERHHIPQYTVQELSIQVPQDPQVKGKGKGF